MKVGYIYQNNPGGYEALIPWEVVKKLPEGQRELLLGLEEEEMAVGILAAHIEGEICVIDSLFVAPQFRRKHGAAMLFQTLREIIPDLVVAAECSYTETSPEHEILSRLLERAGFVDQCDTLHTIFSIQLKDLQGTPLAVGKKDYGTKIDPTDDYLVRKLQHFIQAQKAPGPQGYEVEWDLTRIHLDETLKIDAFLLCELLPGGVLQLSAAYSLADPAVFIRMLQAISVAALKKYPENTPILIQAITTTSAQLVAKLLPMAARKSHHYVFYMRDWIAFYLKTGHTKIYDKE